MKIKNFLKALLAMKHLEEEGEGHLGRYYKYNFKKEINVQTGMDHGIDKCTCKDCAVTLKHRCMYCLGVRIYEVLPVEYREQLIEVLKKESVRLKNVDG